MTVGSGELDAAWVESVYSREIFPVVGQGIGAVTGLVPFSVTEVGGVTLAVVALVLLARRGRRVLTLLEIVAVVLAGALLFAPLWGLNHRRETLGELLGYDVHDSTVDEVRALAEEAVEAVNAAWIPAPGWRETFPEAPGIYAAAAEKHPFLAGAYAPPKALYGSEVLSWVGLLGFYSPYSAEANLNVAAPNPITPFVVLHEMAHQRGIAHEDEANFVAWLLCREGSSPAYRYSGAWKGMRSAMGALWDADRDGYRALREKLDPRVVADSRAYDAWLDAHQSWLREVGEVVNDTYLKSQGVPDGVKSYGRVVDLMLAERRERLGE